MPSTPKTPEPTPSRDDKQRRLDEALADSFPASDPVEMLEPAPEDDGEDAAAR